LIVVPRKHGQILIEPPMSVLGGALGQAALAGDVFLPGVRSGNFAQRRGSIF